MIGRWLGRVLVLAAAAALVWDVWSAIAGGPFRFSALGELWARIDLASLNGAQAFVQRYLSPMLWDPVLQTWLTWPAVLALGAPGALLLLLLRKPERRIFQR